MRFVWDPDKDAAIQEKHGLSFDEAKELFESGEDYLEIFDEAHSDADERFIAIGPIPNGLVLIVWTEVEEETVRIISARSATKQEKELYYEYMEDK